MGPVRGLEEEPQLLRDQRGPSAAPLVGKLKLWPRVGQSFAEPGPLFHPWSQGHGQQL